MVDLPTTEILIQASALVVLGVPALIPAFIAKSKGRSFILWWVYGALPILFFIALIHSLIIKPIDEQLIKKGMKKRPFCAEIIKPDAIVCRYCGRDFPVGG